MRRGDGSFGLPFSELMLPMSQIELGSMTHQTRRVNTKQLDDSIDDIFVLVVDVPGELVTLMRRVNRANDAILIHTLG